VDTLTRRPESYHALLQGGGEGGTKLENQLQAKEEGLADQVIYDKRLRRGFQEWILTQETEFEAYRRQNFEPIGILKFTESSVSNDSEGPRLLFKGTATVSGGGKLSVRKEYFLNKGGLRARWEFLSEGASLRFRFAAETLYALLAPRADDRKVRWQGVLGVEDAFLADRGEHLGLQAAEVWDGWMRLTVSLKAAGATGFWRDALETVSQSEGGYEKVYQGTVLTPYWDLDLKPGATIVCEVVQAWKEEAESW
jgi:alpha-amylase